VTLANGGIVHLIPEIGITTVAEIAIIRFLRGYGVMAHVPKMGLWMPMQIIAFLL